MTTEATESEHVAEVGTGSESTGSEVTPLPKRWPMRGSILDDARAQSRPYMGDESASDRAWASRVDAAVQGMDVVDEPGVDEWMTSHAASAEPHQLEAELVAAWETHVRVLQGDDAYQDEDELVVEQIAITANGEPGALTFDEAVEQALSAPTADDDEGWAL